MEQRKTVFVTGASNVTGTAIAVAFAKAGYDVGFTYKSNKKGAEDTLHEIEACGVKGKHYYMDTRDLEQSVKTLQDFCDEFGALDVMVNNTGITTVWRFLDVTPEQFDYLSEINIRGTYFLMQAAARLMIAGGKKGNIINITSVNAIGTFPGSSVYATTKAAICRMTRSVALELAPYGINVNAFAPGYVDMHTDSVHYDTEEKIQKKLEKDAAMAEYMPLHRWQKPEEIGECIVFMASEAYRFVIGQTLFAEGGVTIPMASDPDWVNYQ